MDLELSARAAATLAIRLAKPKLSPQAQAAERHEPRVKSLLVRAAKQAREAVPMGALEQVLGLGHPGTGAPLYVLQPVLQELRDALMGKELTHTAQHVTYIKTLEAQKKALPDVLLDTMRAGANAKPIPKFAMSFDATNPAAVEWAHDHAAGLIKGISDDVQDAVRLTVVQAFEEGIAPRDVARLIRADVGLTERDAGAVMKQQLKWLADGVAPEKATARAERYANQLLNSRAQTIARTETMRASNEGQRQLWEQAREAGLIDATTMQKVWIATDGACDECQTVDGESVGMDEDFSVGSDPPLHPNCRCTIGLA
jgi:SPP1 gp7 family putative phage head morphogenesis protein